MQHQGTQLMTNTPPVGDEPAPEVECPACGATIRARMADGPGETSTIEGMSPREAADEFERVMPTAAGHPLGRVLIDCARTADLDRCVVCGEPVIRAYGQGSEPVDTLHAIRIGHHNHDAVPPRDHVDLVSDLERGAADLDRMSGGSEPALREYGRELDDLAATMREAARALRGEPR